MTGVEMIGLERERQTTRLGYSADHDETHTRGELARAAIMYLLRVVSPDGRRPDDPPLGWPWEIPSEDTSVGNLTKAGALIAAEIDRLRKGGHR